MNYSPSPGWLAVLDAYWKRQAFLFSGKEKARCPAWEEEEDDEMPSRDRRIKQLLEITEGSEP